MKFLTLFISFDLQQGCPSGSVSVLARNQETLTLPTMYVPNHSILFQLDQNNSLLFQLIQKNYIWLQDEDGGAGDAAPIDDYAEEEEEEEEVILLWTSTKIKFYLFSTFPACFCLSLLFSNPKIKTKKKIVVILITADAMKVQYKQSFRNINESNFLILIWSNYQLVYLLTNH